eukprot:m.98755 g.98755  ORF g.98755 m.98755 type:complete len:315 (-) comp27093_c0_seq1:52-996(-)
MSDDENLPPRAKTEQRESDVKETFLQLGNMTHKNPKVGECGWSNADGELFDLRIGPNYKKHGKKAPSADPFYDMVSMDYMKCSTVYPEMGPLIDIPEPKFKSTREGVPSTLILQLIFPNCSPKAFGAPDAGPCISALFTFQLKEATVKMMENWDTAPKALKLLEEFTNRAPNDPKFKGRFKMMGKILNWEEMSMPSMLKSYNGKPILITASGSVTHNKKRDYLEECANVFKWSFMARKSLDGFRNKAKAMRFLLCCTIQATEDEEMPENALFVVSCQNFSPFDDDRSLTPEAYSWLRKAAEDEGRAFNDVGAPK